MRAAVRRWVFNLHLVLGLTVGLLLVSAGLTGSILVWRHEIDAALHPKWLRVEPIGERMPLAEVAKVAARAYPERPPLRIQMPRAPDESAEVTTAGADALEIFVDPYRGTVLGARRLEATFANALFYWHTSLLSGETGERVMGTVALLLMALVASGLVVWWPGMTRFGKSVVVNWKANWKRVNYDLHRAVGFWATLFLVAIAVTGSSLVFHDAYMAGLNWITRSPPRPTAPRVDPVPGAPSLTLDELVQRANIALPGGEVTYVSIPQKPTETAMVRKKMPSELHPNGRNFIYLHAQTGAVVAMEDALRAPVGSRAYNVLYPIHIGRWAGTFSRGLHTVLGLVPLLLFASGVLMWRNRAWRRPARRVAPPSRSAHLPVRRGARVR